MLFRKKKDVDMRDLQRRGLIRIPKQEVELETDRNGFVDLSSGQLKTPNPVKDNLTSPAPEPGFFNFLDNSSSNQTTLTSSDSERREFTRKLEELDNKIYKLEQRIELIERKSGVGNSSSYSWQ